MDVIENILKELNSLIGDSRSDDMSDSEKRLPEYSDQIFLSDFLSHFDLIKGTEIPQNYKNFSLISQKKDTEFFLNQITGITGGQKLLERIPRSILSDLQPYIKLYLTTGMTEKDYKEYRLPIANLRNLDPGLLKPTRPGLGVNIDSFSWDYLGTHPGDIDYWINCKMKLYIESPNALFHQYKNKDGKKYSFATLLYRRGKKGEKDLSKGSTTHNAHLRYDQKDHRIKVEIGYRSPGIERLTNAFLEQNMHKYPNRAARNFHNALKKNKVTLYLTLVKHTINPSFSSTDFSFELELDFVGSIEQAFLSDNANILKRDTSVTSRFKERLKKAAIDIKVAAEQTHHLTPQLLERIEQDLPSIDSIISSAKNLEEEVDLLEDQLIDRGIIDTAGAAQEYSTRESQEKQHGKVSSILKYLKAKNEIEDYSQKIVASPAGRIEVYSKIICNLNDNEKIYHLELDKTQFRDLMVARKRYTKVSIGEKEKKRLKYLARKDNPNKSQRKEAIDKLKESENGLKDLRPHRKRFRDQLIGVQDKSKTKPEQIKKYLAKMEQFQLKSKYLEQYKGDVDFSDAEKYIKNTLNPDERGSEKTHVLNFFYYGDLLDAVIDIIYDDLNDKDGADIDFWSRENDRGKFKLLLGNIDYIDRETGTLKQVNIAKIPISLKVWQEFWFKFVISKRKDTYYLKSFLRDSFTHLARASLTNLSRVPGDPLMSMYPAVDFINIPESKWNNFTHRRGKDGTYYVTKGKGKNNARGEQRILVMHDTSNKPGRLKSNKTEDNRYGIYHLVPGEYNSPVEQISFTKTDQPFWLEAKTFEDGYLKENLHLSEPYNCNFSSYGNAFLKPGRHINIRFPMQWFGHPKDEGSRAQALGLGGYFLMTKASNVIDMLPGSGRLDWRTTIQCQWETFGNEHKKSGNIIIDEATLVTEEPTEEEMEDQLSLGAAGMSEEIPPPTPPPAASSGESEE